MILLRFATGGGFCTGAISTATNDSQAMTVMTGPRPGIWLMPEPSAAAIAPATGIFRSMAPVLYQWLTNATPVVASTGTITPAMSVRARRFLVRPRRAGRAVGLLYVVEAPRDLGSCVAVVRQGVRVLVAMRPAADRCPVAERLGDAERPARWIRCRRRPAGLPVPQRD